MPAPTFSVLAGAGDTANVASYATASVTPTANRLILVAVVSSYVSANDATPTLSGNGLTWDQINTVEMSGGTRRLTLFRSMGAAPSSGAITIDFGGLAQTGIAWSVVQSSSDVDTTGTNGSGAIVQNVTGIATNTTITITLAAFGHADNSTYGAFGINSGVGGAVTPGSGFTELHDVGFASPASAIFTEYVAANDTGVDASWTGSVQCAAIGVEVKAAAGGGGGSPPFSGWWGGDRW